jgi:hypothetical protein
MKNQTTTTLKKLVSQPLILSLALLALTVGCTNRQGESESPVFLTTNLASTTGQSLTFNIATGAPLQLTTMTITSHGKNPTATDPQGFQTVELNSYVVTFSRLDGGTKVPAPETFAVGGTIPFNGSITLSNFPVIVSSAVQQSPFDQLLPFNGGIDQETGQPQIHLGITVTFFGETAAGTRVKSDPATLGIFVLFSAV